jgi:hypothetical protein
MRTAAAAGVAARWGIGWPAVLVAAGPSLAWLAARHQPIGVGMSLALVAAAAAVLAGAALYVERRVIKRPGVFISYRRAESGAQAARLNERLIAGLGRKRVFMDVDDIAPGADVGERIEAAIASCNVMLVLIGRHWLEMADSRGRRLDDPLDFVRREVEAGLRQHDTKVIPVLVEQAPMPKAEQLPEALRPLAHRNAFDITMQHRTRDERTLTTLVHRELGIPSAPVVVAVAGVIMAMLLVVTVAMAGGAGRTVTTSTQLRSDELTVRLPSSWTQRAAPAMSGFDSSARAAADGADGLVVTTFVRGPTDQSLLPQDFRDALAGDRSPTHERVLVAGGEAYRYDDLAPRDVSQRLTIYAMLTTGGVALVACSPSREAPPGLCRTAVDSLQLRSGRRLPIAPSDHYRVAVTQAFSRLGRRLRKDHAAFHRARLSAVRAVVADQFAHTYDSALAPLRRGVVNPLDRGLNANVTSTLREASSAFKRASTAYSAGDAEALVRIAATLRRLWTRLRSATTALEQATHTRLDRPKPPKLPTSETGRPSRSPIPAQSPRRPPSRVITPPAPPPPPPPPSGRPSAPSSSSPSAVPGGGEG